MPRSVTLRDELRTEDLLLMIEWMSNEHVYRYLNEHQQITEQLKQVYDARLPILTPLFNRNGRFFMICTAQGETIGFLRMAYRAGDAVELVITIGEEDRWGMGYGRASLSEALRIAFMELRRERVIAHIHHENSRSQHLFLSRGFVPCARGVHMSQYQMGFSDYLQARLAQRRA